MQEKADARAERTGISQIYAVLRWTEALRAISPVVGSCFRRRRTMVTRPMMPVPIRAS